VIVGPYGTWLFDCDGVLLDSNRIKTEAFRQLAAPFGETVADAFVQQHLAMGGVSRFVKIRYLHEQLLGRSIDVGQIEALGRDFGASVRAQLLACDLTPGLDEFLARRPRDCRWYVVSGADETELREILAARGIASAFDGICGSPRSKLDIVGELDLVRPAVFFGDGRYDYEVAKHHGIDFVFVAGCTELADWQSYFAGRDVRIVSHLGEVEVRE